MKQIIRSLFAVTSLCLLLLLVAAGQNPVQYAGSPSTVLTDRHNVIAIWWAAPANWDMQFSYDLVNWNSIGYAHDWPSNQAAILVEDYQPALGGGKFYRLIETNSVAPGALRFEPYAPRALPVK